MTGAASHGDTAGAGPGVTVAVVGGGMAGLSAAWHLTSTAPRARVVVLESGDRPGGKLQGGTIGGRAVDLGPDAFLTRRPEAVALCHELGLDDELISPASRTAYVWARGKLRRLPDGLALGVPTRLGPLARSGILSPVGVGRAAVDLLGWPPRRRTEPAHVVDRPVADITRRRLGHEVTARLVDPLIGGIHAGATATMSTRAVFPALLDAAAQRGSLMRALRPDTAPRSPETSATGATGGAEPPVFSTVRGGLSRLVDRLTGELRARDVDVRLNWPVNRLELRRVESGDGIDDHAASKRWVLHTAHDAIEADAVIIATPARAAAVLLEPVDQAVAAMLAAIDYADVTLVTLRLPAHGVECALDGTGFLVPAGAGCLITACTWLTSKWPELQRPGDVLLRASMGRFGDDRPAQLSDDEIVDGALEDLRPMLGLRAPPIEVVVTRWFEAFPQYGLGHAERVSSIERALSRSPAVALAGAAYHGVGIPACIASGRQAAESVLGHLVDVGLTTA